MAALVAASNGPNVAPEQWDRLPLVDHHAHSVASDVPDRASLERFLTESTEPAPPGCSYFDSFLGAAVLRICAPVLGLPSSASAGEYVSRRQELGGEEANRRLLRQAGVADLLVDHGFRAGDLLGLSDLAAVAGTRVREIVRLEHLAESLAVEGVGPTRFADRLAERLATALSGRDAAVGCKSILAYRHGLDIDPDEPEPGDVRAAAAEWLKEAARPGEVRVSHPVLLRHLIWAGLRAGVPLQFHTGYGDADLDLHRANPVLLTGLIRRAAPLGTPIVLLHCYPYHREAAYLAAVYPHVYFDVGLALNVVGHRAAPVLAEALESAPFHKVLYSSDAFGLAELHLVAAHTFRQALATVLAPLAVQDEISRAATMIGTDNARRIYRLSDESSPSPLSRPG
jgi:uncharacterized protein